MKSHISRQGQLSHLMVALVVILSAAILLPRVALAESESAEVQLAVQDAEALQTQPLTAESYHRQIGPIRRVIQFAMEKLFRIMMWPVKSPLYVYSTNLTIPSGGSSTVPDEAGGAIWLSGATCIPTNLQGKADKTVPAIIFVGMLGGTKDMYSRAMCQFAKTGYMTISYTMRGLYSSGGQLDAGAGADQADLTAVRKWLLDNFPQVNPDRIGVTGTSYGGGMALMATAQQWDPPVRAVAGTSAWTDLYESFMYQDTPFLFATSLLVLDGFMTGRISPALWGMYGDLLTDSDIDEMKAILYPSSPIHYIDQINANRQKVDADGEKDYAAIYIGNAFGDEVFQPNQLLTFWEQLDGAEQTTKGNKFLELAQGWHVTADIGGLLAPGGPNEVWHNITQWFDHFLKQVPSTDYDQPIFNVEVKGTTTRNQLGNYPIPGSQYKVLNLPPRKHMRNGGLSEAPYSDTPGQLNTIHSGMPTLANTGIPVISSTLAGAVQTHTGRDWDSIKINRISNTFGIAFESEPLDKQLKVRGVPEIKINITPSKENSEIIAYLYDVNRHGRGRLITYAPFSLHEYSDPQPTPGQPMDVTINLLTQAYNVPKGHRIALVFDTFDILFEPVLRPYSIGFNFAQNTTNTITINYIE